jgi:hypothetical protein
MILRAPLYLLSPFLTNSAKTLTTLLPPIPSLHGADLRYVVLLVTRSENMNEADHFAQTWQTKTLQSRQWIHDKVY